jgi:hypothetical protein
MAQMTERMQKLFTQVPTVVISTATVDGTPNRDLRCQVLTFDT